MKHHTSSHSVSIKTNCLLQQVGNIDPVKQRKINSIQTVSDSSKTHPDIVSSKQP